MAIKSCELNLDARGQQLNGLGTPLFPCEAYYHKINNESQSEVAWHWHEEVEVVVLKSGSAIVNVDGESFIVNEGDGVFINSNALHSMKAIENGSCELNSFLFHPRLISGQVESIFEQRYVRPLLNSESLNIILLKNEIEWQRNAIQGIREAFEIQTLQNFGYELLIREKLTYMWFSIVQNLQSYLSEQSRGKDIASVRVKTMITYLHSNYANHITLRDVAESANVSERECLRCFRKIIGLSPMQYLLKHRIAVSAKLLTDTNEPITEICSKIGFDSPSHFSKLFKHYMECTPSGYRKLSSS